MNIFAMNDELNSLKETLAERFGKINFQPPVSNPLLQSIAGRSSCRSFADKPVDRALLEMLCALAMASPSKSDLQQRDIVIVQDRALREEINQLFDESSWIADASVLLVFCGNNRRQRQFSDWHKKPFPNDHLDAFFNAAVDAGIALSTFVTAAESVGMGCCPISEIRNHCDAISEKLRLPQHVFPVAGLGLGWPEESKPISMRLPLSVTVHQDEFNETNVQASVDEYNQHRSEQQPYAGQREVERFGETQDYGWSEDKARQYSVAQRTDFGSFIRSKGFVLD